MTTDLLKVNLDFDSAARHDTTTAFIRRLDPPVSSKRVSPLWFSAEKPSTPNFLDFSRKKWHMTCLPARHVVSLTISLFKEVFSIWISLLLRRRADRYHLASGAVEQPRSYNIYMSIFICVCIYLHLYFV